MLDDEQKRNLAKLPKATLINFVAEVQGLDKLLDKKIERLLLQSDKPKLIKKLTSTLKGLRRRRKALNYWEYNDFVTELHYLVDDVMSLDSECPKACLDLLELFIDSTESSLERVDDSNGEVSDLYKSLTTFWLQIAAICYTQEKQAALADEQDIVSQAWMEKVKAMACDNDYGTKDNMLRGVNQLFSPSKIEGFIADYQYDYQTLIAESFNDSDDNDDSADDDHNQQTSANSTTKKRLEHALTDLAWALDDIDAFEKTYLYLNTNRAFLLSEFDIFIGFMLEHDAIDVTLRYLTEDWQYSPNIPEISRLEWLSKTYSQQNDTVLQLEILGRAFELQPTSTRFRELLAIASPAQQAHWRKKAYEYAKLQEDVIIAIELWLEIGEIEHANQVAITRRHEFDDIYYTTLTKLLKRLPDGTDLIRVVIYRSLLNDILDYERTMAYGYAARYYKHLVKLDVSVGSLVDAYPDLIDHKAYAEVLRKNHGKKYGFWERLER